MRACFALLLAAAIVLGGLWSPPVSAARPERESACQRLHGKRDLAPARKVKLVRHRNRMDGTTLLGCVLPRGNVRRVAASADYFTSGDSYELRQVARAVVLLDTASFSQYGGGEATSVFDIRTGRRYAIATSCAPIVGGFCPGPPDGNTSAVAAYVNARGQAAAARVSGDGVTIEIAGFSPTGARTVFDSGPSIEIPAASLRLDRSTVTWTRAGQPRSAELPG